MSDAGAARVGFWRTVALLLRASYIRSEGRRKRQRQLYRQKTKKQSGDFAGILFFIFVIMVAAINASAAFVIAGGVTVGQRLDVMQNDKFIVDHWFLAKVRDEETHAANSLSGLNEVDKALIHDYRMETATLAWEFGIGDTTAVAKLRASVRSNGSANLLDEESATPGIGSLGTSGRVANMLGSLALLFWAGMLVFQGEGMELDTQRRRHPAWEWLLSHPVPPSAVFLAEMLAAAVSNPAYYSAPVVPGILFGMAYGLPIGVAAAFCVGIPFTVAAACLGKALEIAVMLRFAPRARGAIIGLMSWFGYSALMAFPLLATLAQSATSIGQILSPLAAIPWPWLGLLLGVRPDGGQSFLAGFLACWIAAAAIVGASILFGIWGARRGLAGNFGAADTTAPAKLSKLMALVKDPAYRKELMWLTRDRSAIIQAFLIPISLAAAQIFNLRGVIALASHYWSGLCGGAVVFGAYFLMVLGPKSLASDGPAHWITLTWPRGLESLLQAKARLWSLIASCIVIPVLLYAIWLYPLNSWQIALVVLGWLLFARSQAQKAVTLATVTSESGETTKVPAGRQMATMLGTFAFAVGVFTQQWAAAISGIVYSYLTAAAMWQNFRARLPYLYDPWSEILPKAPTLMHAMVAISALVELGAIVAGVFAVPFGRDSAGIALAFGYATSAAIVAIATSQFLSNRDVAQRDIWFWRRDDRTIAGDWRTMINGQFALTLVIGALAGSALGLAALGYLHALQFFPFTAEILTEAQKRAADIPHLHMAYVIVGVFFAPFAEEYLFRGLLFRALDKEWGGWRAILGSAAFFAIYHPPISWIPVGALGIANAMIFKRTGNLAAAVALHMVYNAIVLI